MPLDFNEIRQLLATIAQTDISEVTLKSEEFELTVRKAVSSHILQVTQGTASGVVSPGLTTVVTPTVPTVSAPLMETAPSRPDSLPPTSTPPVIEQKYVEVTSPMVGTFYRAPAPGEAPFVEVGDRIRANQTVCIIEAMKLMNEIEAEVSGQVIEILVQNGQPVEYGQPLLRINPD
ncbi:MAG TPA: acetyl-CoA carboxylase biotin carboxyl carrier protein [Nostocaceae cyanobacterium]|nr:acetyl-CoA carboxylase biotin carboxyl carrier protein [Nostocaceae cyanobacterium]